MPYQREVQIYSATLRLFFFLGVSASLFFLWKMLWMSRIGALTSEDPLGRKGADESWCGLTWLISLFGPLFCCLHIVLWDTLTSFQAFSFLLSLHHCLPSLLLILTSSGHRRPRVCARLCLFDSDEASFSVWWSWMYAAVSRPTSRAETEGHQAWTTQKKEMLAANILHRVDDISPLLRTLYLWQEGILIECWNPIFSLLRFALFLRTRTSFFIGVCPLFAFNFSLAFPRPIKGQAATTARVVLETNSITLPGLPFATLNWPPFNVSAGNCVFVWGWASKEPSSVEWFIDAVQSNFPFSEVGRIVVSLRISKNKLSDNGFSVHPATSRRTYLTLMFSVAAIAAAFLWYGGPVPSLFLPISVWRKHVCADLLTSSTIRSDLVLNGGFSFVSSWQKKFTFFFGLFLFPLPLRLLPSLS